MHKILYNSEFLNLNNLNKNATCICKSSRCQHKRPQEQKYTGKIRGIINENGLDEQLSCDKRVPRNILLFFHISTPQFHLPYNNANEREFWEKNVWHEAPAPEEW